MYRQLYKCHTPTRWHKYDIQRAIFSTQKILFKSDKGSVATTLTVDDSIAIAVAKGSLPAGITLTGIDKAFNVKHQAPTVPAAATDTWTVTPLPDNKFNINHYLMLSKSRLTALVVITAMGGYAMAPGAFDPATFAMCTIGTGLLSAAANSMNQFFEVPFDAQMSRTRNRVLVRGTVTPLHAVGFALGASTTGLAILYYGVNGLAASLGLANLILYTSIYTPMKRYSILNTWVGSIVGAIPPVMGWVGCSGTMDAGAWILAGLLYAWQFPHFNALSWNLRPDYSRAGYRMMAVTDPALCRRVAFRYTGIITALSLAAPVLDVTNEWFALASLPLNGYFMYLGWQFYRKSDSNSSRKLFRFSLLHLPIIMVLFLATKQRQGVATKSEDNADEQSVVGGSGLKSLIFGKPASEANPKQLSGNVVVT